MTDAKASNDRRREGGDARERIIQATIRLLAVGGRDEVTTRAVAIEAKMQPPAIYRLFGDKRGLLDAVVDYGFARYLDGKPVDRADADPLATFRHAWDVHVGFGLENPALFALMFGDPDANKSSPAATRAYALLCERIQRLAAAGLLRVPKQRAVEMVTAAGCGTTFALLGKPAHENRDGLSAAMCEALIAAITVEEGAGHAPNIAVASVLLRALLPRADGLSPGERALLEELLDRLAHTTEARTSTARDHQTNRGKR